VPGVEEEERAPEQRAQSQHRPHRERTDERDDTRNSEVLEPVAQGWPLVSQQ
jgi:hypothetical protein